MKRLSLATSLLVMSGSALAIQFELEYLGGLDGTLNTSMTLGAGMRMQDRASDLVGKANFNPDLCGVRDGVNYNSCQGINQGDTGPAEALVSGSGQFTINADNGNWNYDRYDLIQAPFKLTQDLTLDGDGFGFFARWLYFYDFVNNDFEEYFPNLINCTGPNPEDCTPPSGPNALGTPIDLTGETYGKGEPVYVDRNNHEALRQAGTDFQLFDLFAYTSFDIWGDRELSVKFGRQSISWGESTLLALGSINSANPVQANSFFRVGFTPEEVFLPVGALYATTGVTDSLSVEAFYQFEWKPLEAPTPGTFFSATDFGTNNVVNHASISFGGPADDPYGVGSPLNNPLSGLTDSTLTIYKRPDREPSDYGQFGAAFKYYAEDLNNGTDIGFYFMNYHSKLPYASFFGADLSCARTHPLDKGTGSNSGLDAFNLQTLLLACPNLPLAEAITDNNLFGLGDALLDPAGDAVLAISSIVGDLLPIGVIEDGLQLLGTGPVSDAVPLDTVGFMLEYPEDIRMYGMSFNTALGEISLQGELAYRPNMPVQVDAEDLTFAALGPTLTSCHRALGQNPGTAQPCATAPLPGFPELASQSGDNTFLLIPATGQNPNGDGGDGPSVQRSFPSFISSYRGITVGENEPNGYIRGYERVQSLQFNLGATYILGKTQNPIGADQIILLFEGGANRLLNAPERWLYQIEAPGTFRHASGGVVDEDTLAPEGGESATAQQARLDAPGCYEGICVAGTDGLRFNPQQETGSYTTTSAWGYRVIGIVRYESILPGISIQPFFILAHDVNGISAGPGENFVEGRKQFYLNIETRYKSAWSLNTGYGWFTGGGSQNMLRDRDFASLYVRYQF